MDIKVVLDKIEERDVDLIVMHSFLQPWFADIFLSKVEYTGAKVIHIEHSLTDPQLGESDITVIAEWKGSRCGLLIENKIDAEAMPEQYRRYCSRGEIGVKNKDYDTFAVFLIAPQAYLDTNEEAKKYPNQISYEVLQEQFAKHGDIFSATVLARAIEKQKSGYVMQEVPSITSFWRDLYDYCKNSSFSVEMYPGAGAKGSRSTWPQFRVSLRGTALYYKAKPGVVDLQFSGKKAESQRLKRDLLNFLEKDMHWEDTGNSISLRIRVRPIDLTDSFIEHIKDVELMLRAVERLTALATRLNDMGYQV